MKKIINDITFNNPEYFWMLIIPVAHIIWRLISNPEYNSSINFSDINLFDNTKTIKQRTRHTPYILYMLSIILIIVSLARPQTTNSWEENKTEGIDIIIATDISGSMLAKDLKPNRLEASKEIAIQFIKRRTNDRIGLTVFSGKSFTQCPLTTDHGSLINLFQNVKYGMVNDGTAIGDALGTSINRLIHSDAKSKIIILLTDGENTAGKISPLTASEIAGTDSIGIKIYTIGVGTKGMAKTPVAKDINGKLIYDYVEVRIDEELLTNIANNTGGQYFRATNKESLEKIYNKIDKLETTKIDNIIFHTKNEKFYPFSLTALGLIVLSLLLQFTYFRSIN